LVDDYFGKLVDVMVTLIEVWNELNSSDEKIVALSNGVSK